MRTVDPKKLATYRRARERALTRAAEAERGAASLAKAVDCLEAYCELEESWRALWSA